MLFVLKAKAFLLTRTKGRFSYNIPMGQGKFSYDVLVHTNKNVGKTKKKTLRVKINQFCDG